MKSKTYEQTTKERIISDYLSGGGTYRQLQARYGIDFRLIHQWVQAFRGKSTADVKKSKQADENPPQDLPQELKQLQDELRQARLYNKLLEALIDVGKEQYGIDLRKKHGTKQS